MPTIKLLAALAVMTAIGGAASPSWSQPDPDRVTVRVPVGDLDLATERGADVALSRIRNAAQDICGARPTPMEIARLAQHRQCMNVTVGTAVASANLPMLTAALTRTTEQHPTLLARR